MFCHYKHSGAEHPLSSDEENARYTEPDKSIGIGTDAETFSLRRYSKASALSRDFQWTCYKEGKLISEKQGLSHQKQSVMFQLDSLSLNKPATVHVTLLCPLRSKSVFSENSFWGS